MSLSLNLGPAPLPELGPRTRGGALTSPAAFTVPNWDGGGRNAKGQSRPATPGDLTGLFQRIEDECAANLPAERQIRLDSARINQDFYEGNFDPYVSPWDLDRDAIRTVPLLRRVVEVLSADLYRTPPTRTLKDSPEVTDWLNRVYRANATDALLQEADRLAMVNQVAAIEVQGAIGPGSDTKPIEHVLWSGADLVVWLHPDNPRKPVAVATIDRMDEQTRIRLWTPDERLTFISAKLDKRQTAGGRAMSLVKREPNPYGLLPFAFVHFRFPTSYFWSGGIGDGLRRLNHHVNYRKSKIAHDALKWRPIGVVEGANPNFNFPKDYKAGDLITIPPAVIDAGGSGLGNPEVKFVVCDMSYLGQDLEALKQDIDEALEMEGVPASAFRLTQTSTVSGVALFAEQIPVVKWAESRQQPFGYYERDLARVTCAVAAAHAQNNRVSALLDVPTGALEAVAADPDLSLRWKSQLAPLMAVQRQQWDMFRFQFQLVSKTQWAAETWSLSREEAEAMVVETAEDLAREQAIFPQPGLPGETGLSPESGAEPTAELPTPDEPAIADEEGNAGGEGELEVGTEPKETA